MEVYIEQDIEEPFREEPGREMSKYTPISDTDSTPSDPYGTKIEQEGFNIKNKEELKIWNDRKNILEQNLFKAYG